MSHTQFYVFIILLQILELHWVISKIFQQQVVGRRLLIRKIDLKCDWRPEGSLELSASNECSGSPTRSFLMS
jgi:hypothetical protein